MPETFNGTVKVTKVGGSVATVTIHGATGNLILGGNESDGDLVVLDSSGNTRLHMSGDAMSLAISEADGARVITLGANGNLIIGGGQHDGDIGINQADGTRSISLDGKQANIWVGGDGADGDIVLFPSNASHSNDVSDSTIHLDGNKGDIVLRNADCAEDFDAIRQDIEPGSVVVFGDDGRVHESSRPYDQRVAGVISGAGCFQPGIVLDRQPGRGRRLPVALVGKVVCRADASVEPIGIGDLLTTSCRPGRVMRAADRNLAFGSVVGKSLGVLSEGLGTVPMLVGLQ